MSASLRAFSKATLAFAVLFAAGCGDGIDEALPEQDAAAFPSRGTSPLEDTFDAAARDYQVPVELLKAVAFVEPRVQDTGHSPSMTGGHGV